MNLKKLMTFLMGTVIAVSSFSGAGTAQALAEPEEMYSEEYTEEVYSAEYPEETEELYSAEFTEETEESSSPEQDLPEIGEVIHGFEVTQLREFPMAGAQMVLFEHQKTGMKLLYIANDDTNRTFDLTFRTEAIDQTGLPHVFEHSTLSGSEKYPSKALFFNMIYQTYNTFLNAITMPRCTTYPAASLSEEQLLRYADFVTDSCLHPMIMTDESIYKEEAWRYRLESIDAPLTIEGTVYSEMLGAYSITSAGLFNSYAVTFPGSTIGNVSGGHPDYIPQMTWEGLKAYHDKYYHPSNCIGYLYGSFDDYEAFLALLDEAFADYEREEIDHTDVNYTPLEESTSVELEYAAEASSSAEHKSVVIYNFLLPELENEQLIQVSMLTALMNDSASSLMQRLSRELPYGSFNVSLELNGPENCVSFTAYNVDREDGETFRTIVDEIMADYAENGISRDQVDAAKASVTIQALLSRENSDLGVSLIQNFANLYASTGNVFYYADWIDALGCIEEWYENGIYTALVSEYLTGSTITSLTTTYPVPGMKEEKDAALEAQLAETKASMTDEELEALIAFSTAEDTEEDASEYVKQLQAVTVESLPEEYKRYDLIETDADNQVRFIDAYAGVDGVSMSEILLNAESIPMEDLHWLRLMVILSGEIDTKQHTKEEVAALVSRYLYGLSTDVSIIGNLDDYTPYLAVTWEVLDEDMEVSYDLVHEIFFEMDFTKTDQISELVSSLISSNRMSINQAPYNELLLRAMSRNNEAIRYSEYITGLEFYDFLLEVSRLLEEDPESVTYHLEKVTSEICSRTGAVIIGAGNEKSIGLIHENGEAFLAQLGCSEIERAQYQFEELPMREAIIVDNGAQFNLLALDAQTLGIDENDAGYAVLSNYLTDKYLYPMLRDKYGVYGVLHNVAGRVGLYIISYRDPNVAETFAVFDQLGDLLENTEVTQEELDGYILSSYAAYAKTAGELSGAVAAAADYLEGRDQDIILDYMRSIKAVTPERVKQYGQMLRMTAEQGVRSTAGTAAKINENADLYDVILNPFGTEDKSQSAFADVPEDHPQYEAVRYVYENNYMLPESEENFGADEPADAEDLLMAVYVLIGGSPDRDEMVAFMTQNGVMEEGEDLSEPIAAEDVWGFLSMIMGSEVSELTSPADPQNITRADFAEMIMAFVQSIGG